MADGSECIGMYGLDDDEDRCPGCGRPFVGGAADQDVEPLKDAVMASGDKVGSAVTRERSGT